MSEEKIEKFFCDDCGHKTNHFVRGEYCKTDYDKREVVSFTQRMLIVECCGCEHLALVKKTHFSEDEDYYEHPITGEFHREAIWDETIYPPVTYRSPPEWFDDLPDFTLRNISEEIYRSLESESHYLAVFGSRTLIDRLIVLTVGDCGNFEKGLNAMLDNGKISRHERDILKPVIEAGHAAAHRGWAPNKEHLSTIFDTIEGLIHRLLVLPKLAEELEEAVPSRTSSKRTAIEKSASVVEQKIENAPKPLRSIYDQLAEMLKGQGKDVSVQMKKHYVAFRRTRNFASVQLYNQNKQIKVYLNLDPDTVEFDKSFMRDVRQIGHFGTGNLEITIKSKKDLIRSGKFFAESYRLS